MLNELLVQLHSEDQQNSNDAIRKISKILDKNITAFTNIPVLDTL
jgi:hypothetical protein